MPEVLGDHEVITFCMKVAMYTSHELEHKAVVYLHKAACIQPSRPQLVPTRCIP